MDDKQWRCPMCWDYCEMLYQNINMEKQMCGDEICFEGCTQACKYYEKSKRIIGNDQQITVKITEPRIRNNILSWEVHEMTANCSFNVVYVVYISSITNGQWIQIDQTIHKGLPLSRTQREEIDRIIIIAVNNNHIIGYFSTTEQFDINDSPENKTSIDILIRLFRFYSFEICVTVFIVFLCILIVVISLIYYKKNCDINKTIENKMNDVVNV